ncbi:hypothetical protein [Paenibacillus solani]|uniref:hypothetical protein n=1 Tax=Paenibacillus solani TaxID=1705565 RepID=UPI003D2D799E
MQSSEASPMATKHGIAVFGCQQVQLLRSRRNCSGEAAVVPFITGFPHCLIHSEKSGGNRDRKNNPHAE